MTPSRGTPRRLWALRTSSRRPKKTAVENFECIRRLKKDYPSKIIIASIMGRDEDEWTLLAQMAQEAGADIIECNFSCPHMAANGLGSDVGQNPDLGGKLHARGAQGARPFRCWRK